ncbi:glycoside hydrolase family 20 zincin-like fold domain-containing protein [Streptomyces sp. L7]
MVADSASERRVADTLADDLKAAGHGTVPVVRSGTSRPGDIVIEVRPTKGSLGSEGYQLQAGRRLSVIGATETGAFTAHPHPPPTPRPGRPHATGRTHGRRTPAQERGVGVCACYIHISSALAGEPGARDGVPQAQPAAPGNQGEERRAPRGEHLGLLHQGRVARPRRPRRQVSRRDHPRDQLPGPPWTRG